MTAVDTGIIAVYLLALLLLSARWGRGHRSVVDYYVGGRRLGATALGISMLATQSSTISFVSIPAFVALRPGGGIGWLVYELAVPLAMLLAGWALVPTLRRRELISIYEFAEQRYGVTTRRALSLVFLLSRGLATGVAVYATALVLETCLGVSPVLAIVLVVALTVVYDMLGGMTAVVYSDVLQMLVLTGGLGACIVFASAEAGGLLAAWEAFPNARRGGFDAALGMGGEALPLPAFFLGGLFLYLSYYGVDQSQSQRLLAARDERGSRRALLLNGLLRFPLTLGYLALGVCAIGLAPGLIGTGSADTLVPELIRQVLPTGLRGLVFAALLAAGMSSLDSALNALSAVTHRDILGDWLRRPMARPLLISRLTTLAWGVFVGAFALLVEHISPTAIEAINKVGSAFYGPVLAIFLLALRGARCTEPRAIAALASGVGTNLACWVLLPQLHWMWWNALGWGITTLLGWQPGGRSDADRTPMPAWFWAPLAGSFLLIALILLSLGARTPG